LPLRGGPVRIAFLAALLPILIIGAVFLAMLNAERAAALERMTERAANTAGTAIRQYVREELGRLQGLAVSSAIDRHDGDGSLRDAAAPGHVALRLERRRPALHDDGAARESAAGVTRNPFSLGRRDSTHPGISIPRLSSSGLTRGCPVEE
jgi:hypothetical protein